MGRLTWRLSSAAPPPSLFTAAAAAAPPPPFPPVACADPSYLACHGQNGGACLRAIAASECPTNPPVSVSTPQCHLGTVPVNGFCEGDGECGTTNINNCNPGGWDVYQIMSYTPYPPPATTRTHVGRRQRRRMPQSPQMPREPPASASPTVLAITAMSGAQSARHRTSMRRRPTFRPRRTGTTSRLAHAIQRRAVLPTYRCRHNRR